MVNHHDYSRSFRISISAPPEDSRITSENPSRPSKTKRFIRVRGKPRKWRVLSIERNVFNRVVPNSTPHPRIPSVAIPSHLLGVRAIMDTCPPIIVDRFIWFKYAMDAEKNCLTSQEMLELVEMYIQRNDQELVELRALHRKGQPRPKAAREDLLVALRKKEQHDFETGVFGIPDLRCAENVEILRSWEGDSNCIQRIATVQMKKNIGVVVVMTGDAMVVSEDQEGTVELLPPTPPFSKVEIQ